MILRFPLPAASLDQPGTPFDLGQDKGLMLLSSAGEMVEVCPVVFDPPEVELLEDDLLIQGAASPFAQSWNTRSGAVLARTGCSSWWSREELASTPLAALRAARLPGARLRELQARRGSMASTPPM